MQTRTPSRRRSIGIAILVALSLGAATLARAQEIAKEGTFEGNWDLTGTARTLEMDDGEVSVMRLEGPVTITNASTGLAREFDSVCAGVSDNKTGGVARCVWMDSDDDALFLELGGSIIGPAGTTREAVGVVVGGTGKYRGLEGEFAVEWLFWESAFDEGKVTGRDTKFTGSWRLP